MARCLSAPLGMCDGEYAMRKKTLKSILIAIAVVAVIAAVVIAAARLERRLAGTPENSGATSYAKGTTVRAEDEAAAEDDEEEMPEGVVYYNGKPYALNRALTSVLIMGIDDYEVTETGASRNNSQADFLLLAVFDEENETCTLLQIDRDTMTDITVLGALGDNIGLREEQIALAHTYGKGKEDSCENTVSAVSQLLYGIDIENYISLTMGGISVLNDLVGGVTVTVGDDFTGVDDTLVKGEEVTLLGDHAMTFVRARMSMADDPSNIARMGRQRTYMAALTEQLRAAVKEDASFVITAAAELSDYLVSDCDISELTDYGQQLTNYTLTEIITPEGESKMGEKFMEFYVDDTALQKLVIDLFYLPVGTDG